VRLRANGWDKWELYGKFYPELTRTSGDGPTAAAGTTVASLAATPAGTGAIVKRLEMQVNNTYIGFRGEKNLGRGMKAIGQLEQSVPLDEGTVTANSAGLINTFGNRDSFAGLSADWARYDWATWIPRSRSTATRWAFSASGAATSYRRTT